MSGSYRRGRQVHDAHILHGVSGLFSHSKLLLHDLFSFALQLRCGKGKGICQFQQSSIGQQNFSGRKLRPGFQHDEKLRQNLPHGGESLRLLVQGGQISLQYGNGGGSPRILQDLPDLL